MWFPTPLGTMTSLVWVVSKTGGKKRKVSKPILESGLQVSKSFSSMTTFLMSAAVETNGYKKRVSDTCVQKGEHPLGCLMQRC